MGTTDRTKRIRATALAACLVLAAGCAAEDEPVTDAPVVTAPSSPADTVSVDTSATPFDTAATETTDTLRSPFTARIFIPFTSSVSVSL